MRIFICATKAFKRLKEINRKKDARMSRLLKAKAYVDEWSDIPLRQLFPSVCDILDIKKDLAAWYFMIDLTLPYDLDSLAKRLPLT